MSIRISPPGSQTNLNAEKKTKDGMCREELIYYLLFPWQSARLFIYTVSFISCKKNLHFAEEKTDAKPGKMEVASVT